MPLWLLASVGIASSAPSIDVDRPRGPVSLGETFDVRIRVAHRPDEVALVLAPTDAGSRGIVERRTLRRHRRWRRDGRMHDEYTLRLLALDVGPQPIDGFQVELAGRRHPVAVGPVTVRSPLRTAGTPSAEDVERTLALAAPNAPLWQTTAPPSAPSRRWLAPILAIAAILFALERWRRTRRPTPRRSVPPRIRAAPAPDAPQAEHAAYWLGRVRTASGIEGAEQTTSSELLARISDHHPAPLMTEARYVLAGLDSVRFETATWPAPRFEALIRAARKLSTDLHQPSNPGAPAHPATGSTAKPKED